MESAFQLVDEGAAKLAAHPLLEWVRDAPVPLDQRLTFLPALAPFALGYRDICTWVISYNQPRTVLERALNEHAGEDATHSRLFLEDWRALDLDERLGWGPGDVLWWLFLAPDTAPLRHVGMRLLAMPAVDGADALMRCAWAEAIEAAGAVFFRAIAPLAEQLAGRTGRDYRYLGSYHLARETGHVESADMFRKCRLDEAQRALAATLATSTLDMFERVFDCLLDYAMTYVAADRVPRRSRHRLPVSLGPASPERALARPACNPDVQTLLDHRRRRTAQHPLYEWLRSARSIPAQDRLALMLPAWAMDIMGYRDLCLHALRYSQGGGLAGEVNAWAEQLSGHSTVFLADWDALQMDTRLGWTASQTLEWLYLDPCTDVHRRNMATFTVLAAACRAPLARLWLMDALEATGESWFGTTRLLAEEAEQDLGAPLDYLAGRCEGPPADGGQFRLQRLSPAESAHVMHMITTAFNAVDEQLDLDMAAVARQPGGRAGAEQCGSSLWEAAWPASPRACWRCAAVMTSPSSTAAAA